MKSPQVTLRIKKVVTDAEYAGGIARLTVDLSGALRASLISLPTGERAAAEATIADSIANAIRTAPALQSALGLTAPSQKPKP
jgi:hypothetical protein